MHKSFNQPTKHNNNELTVYLLSSIQLRVVML